MYPVFLYYATTLPVYLRPVYSPVISPVSIDITVSVTNFHSLLLHSACAVLYGCSVCAVCSSGESVRLYALYRIDAEITGQTRNVYSALTVVKIKDSVAVCERNIP